ncbi:hypothetical protein [Streptomyces sp. NPDC006510]|uniref:hypothetical protein n=1 Tax=Streptomyces sp. NPDC006510 TaxID=3155600 RepID=UPI0033B52288
MALGSDAQARLGGAVRALLGAGGLEGELDSVRLAVIVLASRTPSETGEVVIRTGELGRWIGLSKSRTASSVVPGLRRSGMVEVETEPGEFGQDDALRCRLLPMWEAHGVVGHPLHLKKSELATLLRLLEAVMAPGWTHRDGRVTAAGLIAGRTGRGAATDRLALLLLVLEARETGRVGLCGGVVDTRRGRPAATLARLLGCSASAAEQVLERLEVRGLVRRPRVRTASGLGHRSRLLVPAVAAAHAPKGVTGDARKGHAKTAKPEFSGPVVTAGADEAPWVEEESHVSEAEGGVGAETGGPGVTATLHTDHSPVVTPVVPPQPSGGFSGEGRGGGGRRPERACMREDQAVDSEDAAAGSASPVAEGGPLRGEQPKESRVDEQVGQRAAGAGAGGRPKAVGGGKAQQQRRVGLPADLRLRVALGPVAWLWERLSGWQQDQVEAAAKTELARLEGLLALPGAAPRLLADRLADRLAETGGEAMVTGPYGWLIGRGLVQRQACSDRRCDDGIRLDTGTGCENCGNVIHTRRARRAQVAAEVDRDQPGLADTERSRVIEDRLRELAAIDAEDFVWRREQAAAERARRDEARAAAQKQAQRERQAAAAADTARQVLPCEDCGQQWSAGLCEACGYRRRTETLIVEAGMIAATWVADLTDPAAVTAVAADVRAHLTTAVEAATHQFLGLMEPGDLEAEPVAAASALAFTALQVVEQALPEYRTSALGRLGRTSEAEAEARRAYKTEQGRRWFQHNPTGADAVAAATREAEAARERTAEHLLAKRLEQLHEQAARPETATAAPWTDRLPELAARPLDDDTAGAVIA